MPEKIEIAIAAQDLASGPLKDIGKAMMGLIDPATLADEAAVAIGTALVNAANDTVDYASEVRKLMQLTGESAESSSRVIQVMDDYKVSTEALTMAQKTLSKDGLSLSIDTLGQLSDEYIALGSSADKTRFLIDHFGRSGLDMAEAMGKGSKAIREASAAVEEGLIMTQKGIDETRDYEKAVDGLNDTWAALTMTVGKEVVPVLTTLTSGMTSYIQALEIASKKGNIYTTWWEFINLRIEENNKKTKEAKDAIKGAAGAMDEAAPSALALAEAEKIASEAAKAMTEEHQTLLSTISTMQSTEDSYAENKAKLDEERARLEAERAGLRNQNWADTGTKIAEVDAALAANALAMQANQEAYTLAGNKMIWELVKQMFLADGTLSEQEQLWLTQNGVAMGLFTQQVADAAEVAMAKARAINDTVQAIQDKTVTVTINEVTNRMNFNDKINRAGGGLASGLTWVGERGPELLDLPVGSYVNNNSNSKRMTKGGGFSANIVVNIAGNADKAAVSAGVRDGAIQAARAMGLL